MTMSRLVRLFKKDPGLRPTEACIICGEPFGDMVHEITHEGSRHLYCHPTEDGWPPDADLVIPQEE